MGIRGIVGLIVGGIAFFIALSVVAGSFYTIDQGERGVVLRNGAFVTVAEPGLGYKLPFIDSVVDISVQTRSRVYSSVLTYSRDQQTAELQVSVNYQIPAHSVSEVYEKFGSEDQLIARVLDRYMPQTIKSVFGRYNAVAAVQDRANLNLEALAAMQKAVENQPVEVLGLQIENIDFSDQYEKSIEDRMMAEVEVQKIRQNAEREKVNAEIAVIQAQARADAVRAEAMARAEAVRMQGEAEAAAIDAKGKALRDNPALVDLIKAENWDGVLPTTVLPNGTLPFIDTVR